MVLYHIHHVLYLVDSATVVVGPRTPLMSVHRTEFAILVSPLVPYAHTVLLKIVYVSVAAQEPQQFVDNRLEVQFLGCQQRKSVCHVKSHLVAEYALSAGSGAVGLGSTLGEDTVKKFQVLLHCLF